MSSVLRTVLARSQQHVNFAAVTARSLSRSAPNCDKPVIISQVVKDASAPVDTSAPNVLLGGRKHTVNDLEKRFLVWSGKYKSLDEVPAAVASETMEKARNKIRIKLANYMILGTVIGCLIAIISGKNAQKRGETVQKMNMDWHQHIKEEALAHEVTAPAK